MENCKLGTSRWHSKTDSSTANSTPNRLHFSSNFNDYLAPMYMLLIRNAIKHVQFVTFYEYES